MFLKVVQKYFELGKSQESTCFDSFSFQTVSEDTTGCLTGRANRLGITTDIKKVNWMWLSDFSINLWSCSLIILKRPYKKGGWGVVLLTKDRGSKEKMLSRWIWKCLFTDYQFFLILGGGRGGVWDRLFKSKTLHSLDERRTNWQSGHPPTPLTLPPTTPTCNIEQLYWFENRTPQCQKFHFHKKRCSLEVKYLNWGKSFSICQDSISGVFRTI